MTEVSHYLLTLKNGDPKINDLAENWLRKVLYPPQDLREKALEDIDAMLLIPSIDMVIERSDTGVAAKIYATERCNEEMLHANLLGMQEAFKYFFKTRFNLDVDLSLQREYKDKK